MTQHGCRSTLRRTHYYINDALYRALIANFSAWQREEAMTDFGPRQCRRFLEREARLLDVHDYDSWLGLFAPECIYWIPGTPQPGDPRREIAISFDDRRRLEDRIFRLRSGYAWSQAPRSRTVRLVTNVEVFATDERRRTWCGPTSSSPSSGATRPASSQAGADTRRATADDWQIRPSR